MIYARPRSPYWWIRVPRLGQPALRESTRVPIDAPTKWQRDQQRAKAEAIYARRVTDLACDRHGVPRDRPAMAFAAWAAWYATNRVVLHKGAGREHELLAHLAAHFGRTALADLSRQSADEYLAMRLRAGVAPSTANREMDMLKAMLTAAVPIHLLASPLAGMKKLRRLKRQKHVLSPEDETAVLEHMIPPDRALFIVAIDTLVRLGDVLDLRRDHDQGDHLVIEDSKTGYYTVPLSRRARAALDSLPDRGPYYFSHRRTAEHPTSWPRAVRTMFRRACDRAGVRYGLATGGVTWHTGTRASGATRMLQRGVDPATVQRIGNWKSLGQMGDYIQTDGARMRAAVDLIGPACAPSVPVGRRNTVQSGADSVSTSTPAGMSDPQKTPND